MMLISDGLKVGIPGRKQSIMGFYAGYGIESRNLGNLTGTPFWDMMQRVMSISISYKKKKDLQSG